MPHGFIEAQQISRAFAYHESFAHWFARLPWTPGDSPLKDAPEYEDYVFQQWRRGSFDVYWRQPELYAAGHYDAFSGIPVRPQISAMSL